MRARAVVSGVCSNMLDLLVRLSRMHDSAWDYRRPLILELLRRVEALEVPPNRSWLS